VITIRVYGTPAPQGSKARGRHGGVYEMSKAVGPWRAAVRLATEGELRFLGSITDEPGRSLPPAEGPVAVTVVFLMVRPSMHHVAGRKDRELKPGAPTRPATRPDIDKLVRSTLDGLKSGGAYGDDGQVADLCAAKVYCRPGDQPGARITIEPCKTEDY